MKQLLLVLVFAISVNQISAQIQVTLKGKINKPGSEFTVFEKINRGNLIEITNFKVEETGDFLVKINIDKPKAILIKKRDVPEYTGIEFWADKGEISIEQKQFLIKKRDSEDSEDSEDDGNSGGPSDIIDKNKVVFFGENQVANNFLLKLKIAKEKNDEYLNKWTYGEKHTKVEENLYKTKHNKLLAQLKLNYKTNIEKKVNAQLDNWIANEIKAFGLLCDAEFYDKKEDIRINGDSTGEIVANKTNVLDAKQTSFIKALKSFPESALLSDNFITFFNMCNSFNISFDFKNRNENLIYQEVVNSIATSPKANNDVAKIELIEKSYNEECAWAIFDSRLIINWIRTNMADKPKFLEYFLDSNITSLSDRSEMRKEQYLMLDELKQKFPNSNYIANAEERIINYTDVAEWSDNTNALSENTRELQDILSSQPIRITIDEYQKGFGTIKVPKKLEQILAFQNQYGVNRFSKDFAMYTNGFNIMARKTKTKECIDAFVNFAVANRDGDTYAFWLIDTDMKKNPIVILDGIRVQIVAKNLDEFIQLLTFDGDLSNDIEGNEYAGTQETTDNHSFNCPEFLQFVKTNFGINPINTDKEAKELIDYAKANFEKRLDDFLKNCKQNRY